MLAFRFVIYIFVLKLVFATDRGNIASTSNDTQTRELLSNLGINNNPAFSSQSHGEGIDTSSDREDLSSDDHPTNIQAKKRLLEDAVEKSNLATKMKKHRGMGNLGSARNIVSVGLPHFPASKISHLLSDDCDVHGPALEELYMIGATITADRNKARRRQKEQMRAQAPPRS